MAVLIRTAKVPAPPSSHRFPKYVISLFDPLPMLIIIQEPTTVRWLYRSEVALNETDIVITRVVFMSIETAAFSTRSGSYQANSRSPCSQT